MNKWIAGGLAGLTLIPSCLALSLFLDFRSASAAGSVGSLDPVPSSFSLGEGARRLGRPEPRTGAAAQALARVRLEALVKTIRSLDPVDANLDGPYYTVPRYTGFPGLCAADAIWINQHSSGQPALSTRTVFRVIGSWDAPGPNVQPAKKQAYDEYSARAKANCAARAASNEWFPGENAQDVWNAVRLLDQLVTAARGWQPLTFKVHCVGFGPASSICANTRSTLAKLDPRRVGYTITAEGQNGVIHRVIAIHLPREQPSFNVYIEEHVPYGSGSEAKVPYVQVKIIALAQPIT